MKSKNGHSKKKTTKKMQMMNKEHMLGLGDDGNRPLCPTADKRDRQRDGPLDEHGLDFMSDHPLDIHR
ncbi:MAG: hypothetical protein ORN51_06515 [Akkermansiaceae bacterium]|nr:hypothetical protein [Akkermansiaceae bacterium]